MESNRLSHALALSFRIHARLGDQWRYKVQKSSNINYLEPLTLSLSLRVCEFCSSKRRNCYYELIGVNTGAEQQAIDASNLVSFVWVWLFICSFTSLNSKHFSLLSPPLLELLWSLPQHFFAALIIFSKVNYYLINHKRFYFIKSLLFYVVLSLNKLSVEPGVEAKMMSIEIGTKLKTFLTKTNEFLVWSVTFRQMHACDV